MSIVKSTIQDKRVTYSCSTFEDAIASLKQARKEYSFPDVKFSLENSQDIELWFVRVQFIAGESSDGEQIYV